jgi:hypothetical protein
MSPKRFLVTLLMGGLLGAGAYSWLRGPRGSEREALLEFDVAAMQDDPLIVVVQATQRFGSAEVAWPFAPVELTPVRAGTRGTPIALRTDAEGHAAYNLAALWDAFGSPAWPVELDVQTTWEGRAVRPHARYQLDGGAIAKRIAEKLARVEWRARKAEDEERWDEAEQLYRELTAARAEDPTAWERVGRAAAGAGHAAEALLAWGQALTLDQAEAGEERDRAHRVLKTKVVELAGGLAERPGPTPAAAALLDAAVEESRAKNYRRAYFLAAAAEDAAPWWDAPYAQAGTLLVAEWLGNQDAALDTWDLDRAIELGSDDARAVLDGVSAQRARVAEITNVAQQLERALVSLRQGG